MSKEISKVDKNRKKTGGRQKGTPNKKTLEFIEALGSFNPVKELINLFKKSEDENIKLGCIKEMLKYVYPQRKAVEIDNKNQKDVPIIKDDIK